MQQLNAQSDGFTYTMNYWMSSYIISRGGKQTKKAYAYEIHVTKSWNNVEEVYEDVFDSYSMDLNTFKRQLQHVSRSITTTRRLCLLHRQ